jgi:hypothetical protein
MVQNYPLYQDGPKKSPMEKPQIPEAWQTALSAPIYPSSDPRNRNKLWTLSS